MHSWLSIEADDSEKLAGAATVDADAVVVDLAAVPMDETAEAVRDAVVDWLIEFADPFACEKPFARWVRIKPTDTPLWREDLVAVMRGAPDGVVLPKVCGPDDMRRLASELYEIEQALGLKHNSTKIMPQIGETPRAALMLAEMTSDPQPRLTAFTWNADRLLHNLKARRSHDSSGEWTGVPQHVRSMTILLAKAMGVMAIDTAPKAESDHHAVLRHADAARQDGFSGSFARGPQQTAAINQAYAITMQDRQEAENQLRAAKKAFIAPKQAIERDESFAAEQQAMMDAEKPVKPRAIF
ncbi:MAG: aldolase/citrate lyase family protein [Pontixanthobacter sp.]